MRRSPNGGQGIDTEGCGYALLNYRFWFLTDDQHIPGSRVWLLPLAQKTVGRKITVHGMNSFLHSKIWLLCGLFRWETECKIIWLWFLLSSRRLFRWPWHRE